MLEYITSGAGHPILVLVNGAGGPLEGWYKIYPALERMGTVFAYNRPGTGGSTAPHVPQTGNVVVTMLRALLEEAGLSPPYLLVGHSLGGLYVNLFARCFPHDVAGVVLLDAAAPDDVALQTTHQTLLHRVINGLLALLPNNAAHASNSESAWVTETIQQIAAAGPFPDVPLLVVTGGKAPPRWLASQTALQLRQQNQQALARLSRHGRQIIAGRSGHFPQFTEPDLVIEAIRTVIDSWQQRTTTTGTSPEAPT
ncbi:MAG: alpha/beta hydrolase [Herpetosiphonaceae bacterium]|nr:MAG: alpha/beta hydrolase [Herpetosiphonaceae bacterium]